MQEGAGVGTGTQHSGPASVVTGMEQNLGRLADMHRRELIADGRQGRAAVKAQRTVKKRDPLKGAPRVRMMWWIAAARLQRAAVETARGVR